jgi:hypothetical protein
MRRNWKKNNREFVIRGKILTDLEVITVASISRKKRETLHLPRTTEIPNFRTLYYRLPKEKFCLKELPEKVADRRLFLKL